MDPVTLIMLVVFSVLVLLVLGVPIAYSLGSTASIGTIIFFGWRPGSAPDLGAGLRPALNLIDSSAYSFVHSYPLSMIPLFIGLGHVAYHADITTDLYRSMRVLLRRLPGGLAMASVAGCAGFSAITGSSVACAAAMGRIAVPEMLRYGYHPRLAAGAVASGGTLGSLIPPSILFVIYALFTGQSVNSMFLAGVVPGLLSLAGFLLTIAIWCRLRPGDAPAATDADLSDGGMRGVLTGLFPAALLFVIVAGGIFIGIFTPTEAAAASFVVALLIGLARQRLTREMLVNAALETVRQTSAIFMIALAAKIFSRLVTLSRVTPMILDGIQHLALPFALVVLAIVLFYLVLGMFLDSIGILVLTLPFTVPVMSSYGADLVWFGVIVIKLLEIGLVTPPVGLNIFVIKSVSPPQVTLSTVFAGAGMFLILDLIVLALLVLFPALSLLLPANAS